MPALTVYLSRLIGVASLFVALVMIIDKQTVLLALGQLGIDRTPLILLGVFRVLFGAAIVLLHNVWDKGPWPLVITLTGWAILLRGVLLLFVPADAMGAFLAFMRVDELIYFYAVIPLVLGVYLTVRGFGTPVAKIELPVAAALAKSPLASPPKSAPRREG